VVVISIKVKIFNESNNANPEYSTSGSSGCDVRASMPHTKIHSKALVIPGCNWHYDNHYNKVVIRPKGRVLIGTGIFCEIPIGYGISIRPRGKTALKDGVTIINASGTIDSDYRKEIGIIIINHSDNNFIIKHGDIIAQFVLEQTPQIEWDPVKSVDEFSKINHGDTHTSK